MFAQLVRQDVGRLMRRPVFWGGVAVMTVFALSRVASNLLGSYADATKAQAQTWGLASEYGFDDWFFFDGRDMPPAAMTLLAVGYSQMVWVLLPALCVVPLMCDDASGYADVRSMRGASRAQVVLARLVAQWLCAIVAVLVVTTVVFATDLVMSRHPFDPAHFDDVREAYDLQGFSALYDQAFDIRYLRDLTLPLLNALVATTLAECIAQATRSALLTASMLAIAHYQPIVSLGVVGSDLWLGLVSLDAQLYLAEALPRLAIIVVGAALVCLWPRGGAGHGAARARELPGT